MGTPHFNTNRLNSNEPICFYKQTLHTLQHMGLDARKPAFGDLRTTKTQTSLRSLFSAFVIRIVESIISKLATSEISIF